MKNIFGQYPNKEYDGLFSLFLQRSIVMLFLKDTIKEDNTLRIQLEVDAWRYVFAKDISKSKLIKNLSKSGLDNLVALEIIDKLNNATKFIEEFKKKEVKR